MQKLNRKSNHSRLNMRYFNLTVKSSKRRQGKCLSKKKKKSIGSKEEHSKT